MKSKVSFPLRSIGCVAMLLLSSALSADDGQKSPDIKDYQVIKEMHRESVKHRSRYRLPAQDLDEECCKIAQRWANRMAEDGFMRHGGGEQIIAKGYGSPKSCFLAWMNSQGHKNWVLCSKEKCGFGCAKDKYGRWFWAGVYRSKSKSKEVKDASDSAVVQSHSVCQNGQCRKIPSKSFLWFRRK